jgi:hypothetical protein
MDKNEISISVWEKFSETTLNFISYVRRYPYSWKSILPCCFANTLGTTLNFDSNHRPTFCV